jgi:pimeloyl-ACP methyl ester carboxylesterase
VQHVADHPETPAMVLLSAHGGGQDAVLTSSQAGLMAGDRYDEITAQARQMAASGRGDDLLLMPGWWYVATANSYLDRMTTMPVVVDLAPRITCPVLYLRGDQESAERYPTEKYQARAAGPCDVVVVPDCDHFYVRREDHVTEIVANWLARTLGLATAA